jgi:methionyl-tRNA synthetase
MNHKNKFVTTTLPYVNSKPHMGHALEMIQADAFVRYLKSKHFPTFFNVGLDEHGQKVYDKSIELGVSTQEYCDSQVVHWEDFFKKFKIEYDNFYRTTSKDHHKKVQLFWNKMLEADNLYKKKYVGKYCVGCESFKLEKDLIDGLCPDHNVAPTDVEEENWFFKLSSYKEHLVNWLDANPSFLSPQYKTEELRNQILGSDDISVSRLKKNVSWGVPVPNDEEQVIYVWFDALLNYIFAAEDSPQFFWQNCETIQLCGPDNLRFQGCIFQAFLAADDMPQTSKLLVHGTVLDGDGKKMSKTLGNVVDPIDQLEKFGLDPVRYYALAGLTTFGDGKWSESDLVELYNSDLANNYGNLLSRVVHLVSTKNIETHDSHTDSFKFDVLDYLVRANNYFDKFDFYNGVKELQALITFGNKYINDEKPWSSDNCVTQLNNLYYLLIKVSEALFPIIPEKAFEALVSLRDKKKIVLFPRIVQ